MRAFFYSLMTDKRKGKLLEPFKWLLYALSLVYGASLILRKLLYKFEIFKSEKVPLKVISVGNITLGGTGKTPLVIILARIMKDTLKREVAILIRGYGWDEQAMLKSDLPDIPVLVGEDRVRSSHKAIRLYGCDTEILDDGFQHWELERDLDIVLINSRDPFGNGHLFPRGILREPKDSLERADIIVFTKVNKALIDIAAAKTGLKEINNKLIFLEAVHSPKNIYDTKTRKELALSALNGRRVILLSGIGDPSYFEDTVNDLGASVVEHIAFGDHHDYSESDVRQIMKRCSERAFDFIVTTGKDFVKMNRMHYSFGSYQLMTLAVEMEITSGKELLIDRLHSLYSR